MVLGPTRREGVTLTEILVAIFVTGVGLLSLLVLFPIGVLNMATAIKDERTADASRNAAAIAQLLNLRDDSSVFPYYTNVDYPTYPPSTLPVALPIAASYPVYVDPQGAALGANRMGVLPGVSPGFARVAPSTINTSQLIARWTRVLDDLSFDETGQARVNPSNLVPSNLGQVQREPRYSFAFMCQQVLAYMPDPPPTPYPMGTSPPYHTPAKVNMTVVVYDRRPNIAIGGVPVEEKVYQASFVAGTNLATLSWNAGAPPPRVRRGTWIFDATVLGVAEPHAYFYRVANVTDLGTTMELQLQQKVRASTTSTSGVAIIMDSVAEVFDKGAN